MKLIYNDTRRPVTVGDTVQLDADTVTVTEIIKPHKPESTGRVAVLFQNGREQLFFPSVIDARWIDREDQR